MAATFATLTDTLSYLEFNYKNMNNLEWPKPVRRLNFKCLRRCLDVELQDVGNVKLRASAVRWFKE